MIKFAVVIFPDEDNAIDVISSSWILPPLIANGGTQVKNCRYPPSKVRGAKLAKLVCNHQPPSSDWLVCSCRVLKEYGKQFVAKKYMAKLIICCYLCYFLDNYLTAREASIRAEETSNLEPSSVEEADSRRIRKRIQNKVKPPPCNSNSNKLQKIIAVAEDSSDESNTLEDDNPTTFCLGLVRETADLERGGYEGAANDNTLFAPPHGQIEIYPGGGDQNTSATHQAEDVEFKNQFVQFLEENRKFQDAVISKLEIISSKLKHINLGTTCAKNIKLTGAPLLPLTSKDGLASLITWLGIDKNSDLMIDYLSLHGGENVSAVTGSILSEIFTNQFATVVSFTGQGQKAVCGIKDSILPKLITKSVRSNKGFSQATDFEVKQAIINWLKNAGDRGGGRAARRQRHLTG
ncbi:uncharacterized protein LOC118435800 isoform X1 [Folsomia candida]|uniref:uncharacterized protein LOC118433100 isoform X1 n=1 Tax=Folsomia candida TaxID=158441 RepID=UPI001604F30F|nr:uncharacterized protein LOC118433100 isoform X1 [Folsomia candida]XP_035708119.1 uncharacterized protein LOC118435800 isoform X1 [Folsomia candida]